MENDELDFAQVESEFPKDIQMEIPCEQGGQRVSGRALGWKFRSGNSAEIAFLCVDKMVYEKCIK